MATRPSADFDYPNAARVYEYLLGGYDYFPPDRQEAERLLGIYPDLRGIAAGNRAFIGRAVTWAADQGVSQFLDLGCGLPVTPSVHQAARESGQASVVYVDYDPMVKSHCRAEYDAEPGLAVIKADLTDPPALLKDPALTAVIDPAEPVCVILGLVLSLMPARQAREVVTGYANLIAPGSLVVISCGRCDDDAMWKQLREAYTAADSYNHTRRQVTGFLSGLEPVPPGIVAAQNWRGGWHDVPSAPPGPAYVLAGVARKPR